MTRALRAVWLGRVGYRAARELQDAARKRILDGSGEEILFLLEHDPVITLGRAAKKEHVLASESELKRRHVALERSTRGGDVTYHGPGQLVAYPVVRLDGGIVRHVESMAEAVVQVAAEQGVRAHFRRDCPGVWVKDDAGERKLAAFGVHVHRRVATHGVAFNIATVLDAFDLIVPCGLKQSRPTSLMQERGAADATPISASSLAGRFGQAYGAATGREIVWDRWGNRAPASLLS